MRKDFLFRNYWWIVSVVVAVSIVIVLKSNAPDRGALIGTAIGTALTFCYFIQKQKLEELTLFKNLFTEFNIRYNEMNDKLEHIRAGDQISDANLRKTLVEYFNLCGEEYLFYSEGFIHKAAWRPWCLGMEYYLEEPRIRKVWDDEVKLDSYYGLTRDVIRTGASLPRNSSRRQKSAGR